MDDFVIIKLDGLWTVTRDGIMLSQRSSPPQAIRAALDVAAEAVADGSLVRVMIEEAGAQRRVVWDSRRDGCPRS